LRAQHATHLSRFARQNEVTGARRRVRALIQRVTRASVTVDDEVIGAIDAGLLVLVGVTHTDATAAATRLAAKVAHLRVFDDDDGTMNRSLLDVGGAALVVSQFTLYGDARKGRRPSWVDAARPEQAEPLVAAFATALGEEGIRVETGRFRTDMQVELVNDGPVTLALEV
jgi:D-tyrosyl-tRNA(Tyr) deacylase